MNFFKRATTSILRRSGKTIILLLLVFILGTVIAGAISVRGAINNTDANLRRRMPPIVSIGFDEITWHDSIDWDEVDWEDPMTDPWLTREEVTLTHIREVGDLPYVDYYDYMILYGLSSFELQRYEGANEDEDEWLFREEGTPEWFSLRGTSRTELIKIEEGIIDLVEGNQFDSNELVPGAQSSVAIVSEAFANTNNLSLGSTFELYDFVFVPQDPDEEDDYFFWDWEEMYAEENIYARVGMEFLIVGLFDIPIDPNQETDEGNDRVHNLNNIYVPNWALEDVQTRLLAAHISAWEASEYDLPEFLVMQNPEEEGDEEQEMHIIPIFILDDPAYIEDFRTAAEPLLPEYHTIEDLSSSFDDITSSMETMQTISNWILYASVIATLLILSLLITLFLRDRRYEMGVYLALGEKKGKIVSQILMEVVVTSFVGITLAVFAGNFISDGISQNMVRNALAEEVANQNDDMWGWGEWTVFDEIGIPTTMSIDEMADAFQVTLDFETIGLFYIVGLGAVVLSTLIPVIYVVTLNPKKVLM